MTTFINLINYNSSNEKENEFFNDDNRKFILDQSVFLNIPGKTICYESNDKIIDIFKLNNSLKDVADFKTGITTGDNTKFMRSWFEIQFNNIYFNSENVQNSIDSGFKWFPCKSGGTTRKWFGNNDLIINYQNDGYDIKHFVDKHGKLKSTIRNQKYYFRESITWSKITSNQISVRYAKIGSIFDAVGLSAFEKNSNLTYIMALLNSKPTMLLLSYIRDGLSILVGNLVNLPFIVPSSTDEIQISKLTQQCIDISCEEWDSREISWDFNINELIHYKTTLTLEDAYNNYCTYWKEKFHQLHTNEEELNRIFIDIYGLEDELTPDVPLKDITILKTETEIRNGKLSFKKDVIIKQFISYAVGCMFGRYSPEKPGLILANQGETLADFKAKVPNVDFMPDEDNIIPVLDNEYFSDDIVGRFKEFLKFTFGAETLSVNLDFIAGALAKKGGKGSEQVIRDYFIKDFYKDHLKMYKKRPIYWMFTSGKGKAFNALVYMHRYDKQTLAKMRMDYLLELESKMDAQKGMLDGDKVTSQRDKLAGQIREIMEYDEVLKNKADAYIEIDLDDGVKVNYAKFEGLVGKI
ncbi:BREX-1 system adenine-specific DNA-methyltransferase PglX [Methanococcoides alaskense]|uniref:site-specific DNA-methyltransferase (adenine-specific) n=1 Tax=Methanococcoides alaskense TaxID=325778 RepID=A0AA90Z5Z5_9EURY|nr:BREX-1 system adenine-specific DNA-methyltransferase PglX [Methanococcoides alaskense]MDA0525423.1 BREX-1 system adenine-specific DNA-methyltransferase PglX [Methanococcoides alaskense]MDR6221644.1 type II restriction/modification system DNA methylase subunit YeeA [Methanococcoides alaskense]